MTKSTGRRLLRREERQAAILEGAAAAFARSGFAATSMDDVAEACGVSRLILYRNFDSKEDLYRAILQRVFDRQAIEFVDAVTRVEVRGVGFRSLLNTARAHPDGFVLLWRHAARESPFADYAREHRDMAVTVTAQLLALHSGDELLDRWTAETVYSYLVDAVLHWLDIGDPARDEAAADRCTDSLLAMVTALRAAEPGTGGQSAVDPVRR